MFCLPHKTEWDSNREEVAGWVAHGHGQAFIRRVTDQKCAERDEL